MDCHCCPWSWAELALRRRDHSQFSLVFRYVWTCQYFYTLRFYAEPPFAKDELMARIRADATISEPVREWALEFARE